MELYEQLLIKEKSFIEIERKTDIENRLNIYSDNWETILSNEIDNQFHVKTRDNIKQMLAIDINVAKRIVKEISVVYQEAPKRSYMVNEKEDGIYSELMAKIPVDLTMQEVNRMTNLCNECILYVVPRNGRIEYDILTPDLVEIYQNPNDAKKVEALVYTQAFIDTKGNTEIYYIYWDIYGKHIKFDKNLMPVKVEGNEGNVNPYKDPNNPGQTILPFVIFHKDYNINSVWNRTGGKDMVSSTKQVGVLLTYLNYIFKTQSFKQKYFTGINIKDVPKDLVQDPLYSLVVDNVQGTVGVLDYQVAMNILMEIIYAKIGAISNNYGMSLDNFKLIGSAQSGYSLKIKNLGLEKVVKEQIKFYRWYEQELFNVTKIVNNTKLKSKIPDGGTFKIDFVENNYPENPEDLRKQWLFDIKIGAKNIVDYAMSVNPDLKNIEEAKEYIETNVDINKAVAEKTGLSIEEIVKKAFEPDNTQAPAGGQNA